MKKIIVLFFCVFMAFSCIQVSAEQEKLVILLDPGHGGSDAGASASSGGEILLEKDCNLLVALAVKERLEATGRAVVYMTRSDDTYVSLKARTDMLPDCGAQLFCSIHCNSGAPGCFWRRGVGALWRRISCRGRAAWAGDRADSSAGAWEDRAAGAPRATDCTEDRQSFPPIQTARMQIITACFTKALCRIYRRF